MRIFKRKCDSCVVHESHKRKERAREEFETVNARESNRAIDISIIMDDGRVYEHTVTGRAYYDYPVTTAVSAYPVESVAHDFVMHVTGNGVSLWRGPGEYFELDQEDGSKIFANSHEVKEVNCSAPYPLGLDGA